MIVVQTQRLMLRQWRDEDRPLFAAMNGDPEVMKYFPNTLSSSQSDTLVDRFTTDIEESGWGFWAAERSDTGEFIGFIGINYSADGLPFAPCVDIGWRLARAHWGLGFATEGAKAAMDYAFWQANLSLLVSMTPTENQASERIMQKLGMVKQALNFMHPKVVKGHPLQEHVLYSITNKQWQKLSPAGNDHFSQSH